MVEQIAEALVGLLGGTEAGELADGPQAPAVHRRVDPARERVGAGQPDLLTRGKIDLRVQRADLLATERQEGLGAQQRRVLALDPLGVRRRDRRVVRGGGAILRVRSR